MLENSDVFLPFEEKPVVVEYPYIGDRIQSAFIDFLFMIGLVFSCAALLNNFPDTPGWLRAGLFGIWILYEPFFIARGCTLGNYIKGIRVRRADNVQERIGFFPALLRYVVKCCLG